MDYEIKIEEFCEFLNEKYKIAPNKISFSKSLSSVEKAKGKAVSYFIQIFEYNYPENKVNPGVYSPVIRIPAKTPTEIIVSNQTLSQHLTTFCENKNISIKTSFNKKTNIYQNTSFTFQDINDVYLDFIDSAINFSLKNYISASDKFGCCGRYKECSDANMCIHPNKLYATSCEYRKHLEAGNIFYK